ncbi:MAG: aspartyl/glutamyl-tRNA amidotransferase subunit C [Planctomycetes bacterium]|nr:aspartyl/glutamyl-tRNA amidotransferase subunit C [Planctomycetota bacterium]
MPKPPPIDRDLVAHLGALAHLRLPAAREQQLCAKLAQLVEAFSALDAADLGDLDDDAAKGPLATPDTLRPDRAEAVPPPEDVLANAPRSAADSFVVPRVVEP